MKVAITSKDIGLSSPVGLRFGRAEWLIVVDIETAQVDTRNNEVDPDASILGIQTAQNVIELNVEAVITGNIGPNAFTALNAAEIRVFLTKADTVAGALASFIAGNLSELKEANVSTHWSGRLLGKQKHQPKH